ncbi:DUF2490 domain-containing protein [Pedobacter sp. HMF7647]|uniref:DUF2490 domain-containing protein n=1 Tax=Hufsiella arboris TaxID=2695275 RepID=A0A7K1YDQ9_9SPHI|nr:DUF2490 domain-containing protein [Hufsiella arboris]MXV52737.1 DUF2490 domain-containing protein [Hufsiella arboris]
MKKLIGFVGMWLLFISQNAYSQKWGTWGIGSVVLPASEKGWGAYMEAQVRTNAVFDEFQYYEVKGGISYDIDKNFTALIGTGRYETYDYRDLGKGPVIGETRLWEQMTINQFLNRLKFEHRYRIEQRWLNGVYRNRYRYRLNLILPLNNVKLQPKTFFVNAFDEIFLNNKAPRFERNRISAGLGYQATKTWIFQAGWLNQTNFSLTEGIGKNNLMMTVIYRIDRKKQSPNEHLPTHND